MATHLTLPSLLGGHAAWLSTPAGLPASDAQRRSEAAAVVRLQSRRTPARDAAALALDTRPWTPWVHYLRDYAHTHGLLQAARATELIGEAVAKSLVDAARAKHAIKLARPYALDPRVRVLGPHGSADASFPSGHTSAAYAAAQVMSQLWPERAREFQRTAAATGQARIYSGVHLPSDVRAGARIGRSVARQTLAEG